MNSCYFLTWNLGGHKNAETALRALELAAAHLVDMGTCIAALQEVHLPTGASVKDIIDDASKGLLVVIERTLGAKVLLLHSRNVRSRGLRAYGRMVGATFGADVAWGGLQVLGVHLDDRQTTAPGTARGFTAAGWQGDFVDFWKGGPLVVMGDFNADPYDPEMCARSGGFFALRDRDTLDQQPMVADGALRLPIFNPMWAHLSEKDGSMPRGTNAYRNPHQGPPARTYDQILVSRELVDSVAGLPGIWARIGDKSLITKRDGRGPGGYPRASFTDHLPVGVFIDLEGVSSCRI